VSAAEANIDKAAMTIAPLLDAPAVIKLPVAAVAEAVLLYPRSPVRCRRGR